MRLSLLTGQLGTFCACSFLYFLFKNRKVLYKLICRINKKFSTLSKSFLLKDITQSGTPKIFLRILKKVSVWFLIPLLQSMPQGCLQFFEETLMQDAITKCIWSILHWIWFNLYSSKYVNTKFQAFKQHPHTHPQTPPPIHTHKIYKKILPFW